MPIKPKNPYLQEVRDGFFITENGDMNADCPGNLEYKRQLTHENRKRANINELLDSESED